MIEPEKAIKATQIFIEAMRREWNRTNPLATVQCPVKNLEQYDGASRVALVRSISRVLETSCNV